MNSISLSCSANTAASSQQTEQNRQPTKAVPTTLAQQITRQAPLKGEASKVNVYVVPGPPPPKGLKGIWDEISSVFGGNKKAKPFDLVYVSGSEVKRNDMRTILDDIPFECATIENMASCQKKDIVEVAKFRACEAYKTLRADNGGRGRPVLLDETALELEGEDGYPGLSIKEIMSTPEGRAEFAQKHQGKKGFVHTVFAYTVEGGDVMIAEAKVPCEIVWPLRIKPGAREGIDYLGWDPCVLLNGNTQTAAEAPELRKQITHRQWGGPDLKGRIIGATFPGLAELHVTVNLTPDKYHLFETFCEENGQVALPIEQLDGGKRYYQPQTQRWYISDDIAEAERKIAKLGLELIDSGFEPVSYRIEVPWGNSNVPVTDAAAENSPTRYFEVHTTVRPVDASKTDWLQDLMQVKEANGASLSKVGEDYCIDERYFGIGRDTAQARNDKLMADIVKAGLKVEMSHKEYVVFDDAIKKHYRVWPGPFVGVVLEDLSAKWAA